MGECFREPIGGGDYWLSLKRTKCSSVCLGTLNGAEIVASSLESRISPAVVRINHNNLEGTPVYGNVHLFILAKHDGNFVRRKNFLQHGVGSKDQRDTTQEKLKSMGSVHMSLKSTTWTGELFHCQFWTMLPCSGLDTAFIFRSFQDHMQVWTLSCQILYKQSHESNPICGQIVLSLQDHIKLVLCSRAVNCKVLKVSETPAWRDTVWGCCLGERAKRRHLEYFYLM